MTDRNKQIIKIAFIVVFIGAAMSIGIAGILLLINNK
jgi:hypothetical protein